MNKKLSNEKRIGLTILGIIIGFLFEELSLILGLVYWLFVLSFFIKMALDYKKGLRYNEIRIPTKRDSYIKMTFISFGFMMVLSVFIGYFLIYEFPLNLLSGSVLGILLIVYGFIKLPQGILMINNGQLSYFFKQEKVEVTGIEEIVIYNNLILFLNESGGIMYGISQLELESKDKTELVTYFKKQLTLDTNDIILQDKIWQTKLNDKNEL